MFKYLNRGISVPLAIGIIAVLVIVVGGGIIVYQYKLFPAKIELEFSSTECDDPITLEQKKEEIKEIKWLDNNTLEVKVYAIINCCNEIGRGDFEIKGNKITLKFEDIGEGLCKCLCGRNLLYKFSNIKKKDYNFEIVAEKLTSQGEPRPISFSNDCNELIGQVNDLVEEANYCEIGSDCVISTEVTEFCGCWSLINKNADLSKTKEGNEKYTQLNCPVLSCGECMLLPKQEDIKCQNNKCVDTGLAKSDFSATLLAKSDSLATLSKEFAPSEVMCDINPATGKKNLCYCKYDETRDALAIIIKKNGIYDDEETINIFNQYFKAVKKHLKIKNVWVKKFTGSTIEDFDKFIETMIKEEKVGYAIVVGADLPIIIGGEDPAPGASYRLSLDLDNLNFAYSYVARDASDCKDVAISFVIPPLKYVNYVEDAAQSREFVISAFNNFIKYHDDPLGTYNKFNGKTLVIRDPEFYVESISQPEPFLPETYYKPVFLSNWSHSQIESEMKKHYLILSYHVHGGPETLGLGLKNSTEGSTNTSIDEIIEFYNRNGQISLFVDIMGACNAHILGAIYYDYENPPRPFSPDYFCCWPQTWLKTSAWAVLDVNNHSAYSFEKWLYEEKIVGKALRKTHHSQGMIYGDILAEVP